MRSAVILSACGMFVLTVFLACTNDVVGTGSSGGGTTGGTGTGSVTTGTSGGTSSSTGTSGGTSPGTSGSNPPGTSGAPGTNVSAAGRWTGRYTGVISGDVEFNFVEAANGTLSGTVAIKTSPCFPASVPFTGERYGLNIDGAVTTTEVDLEVSAILAADGRTMTGQVSGSTTLDPLCESVAASFSATKQSGL